MLCAAAAKAVCCVLVCCLSLLASLRLGRALLAINRPESYEQIVLNIRQKSAKK